MLVRHLRWWWPYVAVAMNSFGNIECRRGIPCEWRAASVEIMLAADHLCKFDPRT